MLGAGDTKKNIVFSSFPRGTLIPGNTWNSHTAIVLCRRVTKGYSSREKDPRILFQRGRPAKSKGDVQARFQYTYEFLQIKVRGESVPGEAGTL